MQVSVWCSVAQKLDYHSVRKVYIKKKSTKKKSRHRNANRNVSLKHTLWGYQRYTVSPWQQRMKVLTSSHNKSQSTAKCSRQHCSTDISNRLSLLEAFEARDFTNLYREEGRHREGMCARLHVWAVRKLCLRSTTWPASDLLSLCVLMVGQSPCFHILYPKPHQNVTPDPSVHFKSRVPSKKYCALCRWTCHLQDKARAHTLGGIYLWPNARYKNWWGWRASRKGKKADVRMDVMTCWFLKHVSLHVCPMCFLLSIDCGLYVSNVSQHSECDVQKKRKKKKDSINSRSVGMV